MQVKIQLNPVLPSLMVCQQLNTPLMIYYNGQSYKPAITGMHAMMANCQRYSRTDQLNCILVTRQ